MRNKLIAIIFILLVATWADASFAVDQLATVDKELGLPFQSVSSPTYIGRVIKEIIKYTGLLAVMALTYGGIIMMLSYGDDGKIKSAKKIITYSLIGVVLSGVAFAIIDAVNSLKLG
ncbi:MAG: hypothetical protein ACOYN2_01330 [Patescibacteria group bacterium]